MKSRLLLLVSVCTSLASIAQDKVPVKFGKVSPQDFSPRSYSVDSSADAVIIADVGNTELIGNSKGWFSLQHTHYRRAHILHKNGYDIADVSIYLYTNGEAEEQLDKLKAITYNLENGKVVETKLETKSNVFKDRLSKNNIVKKFTFPNVKEGSIIEYEYTTISDFIQVVDPWEFQGKYPRIWSEFNFEIPAFFNYIFIAQGYRKFDIKTNDVSNQNFTIRETRGTEASETFNLASNVTQNRWVMKDVPPLKREPYTSTLENHIAKLDFQLTEQRDPLTYHRYLGTWQKLSEDLRNADYFGQQLSRDNGWLDDYIDPVAKTASSKIEKAHNIYRYVQDNFTCTSYNRFTMDENLRNIAKTHKGSVAEINLLLIAMLRREKIDADPVILSTREHGYTYPLYPLPTKFNYTICRATIDGQSYFLDASHSNLGFGKLEYDCYNGHARVIDEMATPLEFLSDSLKEQKLTSVFMINDEKGNLAGSVQQALGYFESNTVRDKIKEKGEDQFFSDIKKSFTNGEVELSEQGIDSLKKYDDPVAVHYKFDLKEEKGDLIYFNPMFMEGWKDNPFKSAERFYPVEMPYTIDETYILRMDVPDGYVVDELPKQLVVKLNENDDGMFEYRISSSNNIISLRSRLRLKRAYYMPDEYESLREFFSLVVKKHAEQIVFKKKQ